MIFTIKADAQFVAKNVQEALKKLAKHFDNLSNKGLGSSDIFISGEIEVKIFEHREKL